MDRVELAALNSVVYKRLEYRYSVSQHFSIAGPGKQELLLFNTAVDTVLPAHFYVLANCLAASALLGVHPTDRFTQI